MATIRRKVKIHRLTPSSEYDKTPSTIFMVRGDSPAIYKVRVDGAGLYSCSCKSGKFRGFCYHVEMVRMEKERIRIINKLYPPTLSPTHDVDFNDYFSQERFIAEPLFSGPTEYITFGRYVHLGKIRRQDWEIPGYLRLAGTILVATWDDLNMGRATKDLFRILRVFDCVYQRGVDLRNTPLAFRRDFMEELCKQWSPPGVAVVPCAASQEDKQKLVLAHKNIVLKDIASPWDLSDRSPRAWVIKGSKKRRYGKDNKEDGVLIRSQSEVVEQS